MSTLTVYRLPKYLKYQNENTVIFLGNSSNSYAQMYMNKNRTSLFISHKKCSKGNSRKDTYIHIYTLYAQTI